MGGGVEGVVWSSHIWFVIFGKLLGTNTSFEGSLNTALLDFIMATGLDHLLDASEGLFEAVEGGRVDHLLFDAGGIGTPADQKESRPVEKSRILKNCFLEFQWFFDIPVGCFCSLSVHNILIIVNGVTAVIRIAVLDTQIGQECIIVWFPITDL